MPESTPDTPSSDFNAMSGYWRMVSTILDGAEAMRKAGKTYLPKFEAESDPDYEARRSNAKFTNIYRDIVENLAAKPFTQEVKLVDKTASESVLELIEDIDGQGNHLHVFAASLFFSGINDAVSWILVDKTKLPEDARSREDEKRLGARPYWVHIPATSLLAVYSVTIDSKEIIHHARILETAVVQVGFGETIIRRVRIFDRALTRDTDGRAIAAAPATWTLMEERKSATTGATEWVQVGTGLIAIEVIPLVPFITGRRKGRSWQFVPPMQDAAYLQIKHYQYESGLDNAADNTAFAMLAGNGVAPPVKADGTPDTLPVGPKRVLYAPPTLSGNSASHGEWKFIEPEATSLKFLEGRIENTEKQLRELGRQPLTAQTGNLTVVTTAFAAQKGNSAIQAWCFNEKDALEKALQLTCLWLADSSKPQAVIYTDFDINMENDKARDFLLALRKNGDMSREAIIAEGKRRGDIMAEYDAEADLKKILAEGPADEGSEEEGAAASA